MKLTKFSCLLKNTLEIPVRIRAQLSGLRPVFNGGATASESSNTDSGRLSRKTSVKGPCTLLPFPAPKHSQEVQMSFISISDPSLLQENHKLSKQQRHLCVKGRDNVDKTEARPLGLGLKDKKNQAQERLSISLPQIKRKQNSTT